MPSIILLGFKRVLHRCSLKFAGILAYNGYSSKCQFVDSVKDMRGRSRVTQSGVELLQSGRELTTKVGEQPWPQLMHCASICCHVCGCIFQEDGIVVRSAGEEWYILIGVEMDIKDVNDFNLRTKELGCNYWGTYTKSGIGGVQVTSLHCDPIGVDNRSLGVKN